MIEESKNGEEGKAFVKEFDKCPQCGSSNRFFEGLGQELKERGLVEKDMKFYYDMKRAPMANEAIMAKLPIGGEIPAFAIATDVCLDCGTIYAVRVEKSVAKKGLAPVQFTPNRAQRRAGMGGNAFQLPPALNNPFLS